MKYWSGTRVKAEGVRGKERARRIPKCGLQRASDGASRPFCLAQYFNSPREQFRPAGVSGVNNLNTFIVSCHGPSAISTLVFRDALQYKIGVSYSKTDGFAFINAEAAVHHKPR